MQCELAILVELVIENSHQEQQPLAIAELDVVVGIHVQDCAQVFAGLVVIFEEGDFGERSLQVLGDLFVSLLVEAFLQFLVHLASLWKSLLVDQNSAPYETSELDGRPAMLQEKHVCVVGQKGHGFQGIREEYQPVAEMAF